MRPVSTVPISAVVVVPVSITAPVHQVLHPNVIPAAKPFAIRMAVLPAKPRMPVLIPVLHIGLPVVLKVAPSTLDAVMKALPLHVLELLRGLIPSPTLIPRLLLRWRSVLRMHHGGAPGQKQEPKHGRGPKTHSLFRTHDAYLTQG